MSGRIKVFISDIFRPDALATFINYIVKLLLKPIIIVFVPVFLSESNQGYWYTFVSVAALTSFADLGFTSIMSQFAAHEYTYLCFEDGNRRFKGEQNNIERISSLFQFLIKWLCLVLLIAMVVIFFVGYAIFSKNNNELSWIAPWAMYVIATIVNFAIQVEISFFEGCDQFAITQRIRAMASIVNCISTIIMLCCGFELYSLAIPLFLESLIQFILMKRIFGKTLAQMIGTKPSEAINWVKDFVPLLGRYAVSWISGYFASQIYNPLVFSVYGSTEAGKVGYTMSLINAIYGMANVWSLLAIPKYNMAVERRKWDSMDKMLKKNVCYSLAVYGMGVVFLIAAFNTPLFQEKIGSRILPIISVVILGAGYALLVVSYCLSTYLRAHKKEPLMIPSLLNGVIGTFFTVVFFQVFGVNYIFSGVLIANIIVLPISLKIWSDFRNKWHVEKTFI